MLKRLDVIAGIAGCVGGAGLAYIGQATKQAGTLEIGLAVLVASAVYLLFRSRIAGLSVPSLPANKSFTLIIHIVFFAAFAASVYLMHSSIFRPPLYFILTSVCVVAVVLGTLSSSGKSQTGVLLLEILMISFSLRFGLLYELPSLYGVDPWVHSAIVEDWLGNGHISQMAAYRFEKYAGFPVMHLNIMLTRLVTSLDPKDSYYLSIGLFYSASIIFVFLIGRSLVNTKIGLLAMLLISTDIFHISWGALLIPTSLGLGIFTAVVWLVFKGASSLPHVLILIFLSVVLIFTHPMAALATVSALSFFLIADFLYRRLYKKNVERMSISFIFVILFWVAMLVSWIYANASPSQSIFATLLESLLYTVKTNVEFTGGAFEASATPLGPLNRVGFLMFIGFVVIGSMFWLSQKKINNRKFAIIVSALGLTIIAVALPFFNIGNLFPGRWLPFVSILAAVVAVKGIMALSHLFDGRIAKASAAVLILFVTSIFMINSQAVNTRTPFYGRDYMQDPFRNALFASELRALKTFVEIYDGPITVDGPYLEALRYGTRVELEKTRDFDINGKNEGLIVVRKYSRTHPVINNYDEGKYSQLLAGFEGLEYNTVYSNGEVKAYVAADNDLP